MATGYIYIYIYNTPTYGCASMLAFILNVLGEVLGIGNLYFRPEVDRVQGQGTLKTGFETTS